MNRAGITGFLMALLESRLRVDCCELIFSASQRELVAVVAVALPAFHWSSFDPDDFAFHF